MVSKFEGQPRGDRPKPLVSPPKYDRLSPVSREEIAAANRELARGTVGDLSTADLLRRAEATGQPLHLDEVWEEGSEFARFRLTTDPFGDAMKIKMKGESTTNMPLRYNKYYPSTPRYKKR